MLTHTHASQRACAFSSIGQKKTDSIQLLYRLKWRKKTEDNRWQYHRASSPNWSMCKMREHEHMCIVQRGKLPNKYNGTFFVYKKKCPPRTAYNIYNQLYCHSIVVLFQKQNDNIGIRVYWCAKKKNKSSNDIKQKLAITNVKSYNKPNENEWDALQSGWVMPEQTG